MENNRFAIIIPVYNAEKYLPDCIESLLSQTYTDWEAICINDGSSDASGDILHSYAGKDKRLKVFHQTNKGTSSARNLGLSIVPPDWWVSFIDADDYVSATMYEDINRALTGQDVDYVRLYCTITHERYAGQPGKGEYTSQLLDRDSYFKKGDVGGYICSIMVRSSLLKAHGLAFNEEMATLEDQLFSIQCALHARHLMLYNRRNYYYYQHPESTLRTHTGFGQDIIRCIREVYRSCRPYMQTSPSIHRYFWKKWLPQKAGMYIRVTLKGVTGKIRYQNR